MFPENSGDGSQHAAIGDTGPFLIERTEPKHVDPAAIAREPVERLVHQARVVAAVVRGGEHQRFRIDHQRIGGACATRDADGGPLAPEEIDGQFVKVPFGIGKGDGHGRGG